MDEQDGRLRLLESELTANDGCIRSYDTTSFKVKGWCVTVTRAVAGFAASGHKSLLVIGVVAVVGFWLLDAQIRAIQREFINRNKRIARASARRDWRLFSTVKAAFTYSAYPTSSESMRRPARLVLRTCVAGP